MSSPSPDIAGLREQVLANAAFVFNKAVLRHHHAVVPDYSQRPHVREVSLSDIFDIIIMQKRYSTRLTAKLVCGDLRERILLAEGESKGNETDALLSLSRVMCKACGKKEYSLVVNERDMKYMAGGIINDHMMR